MYCNKCINGGGITRFKEHLAGIKGDTAPCPKVDSNVKWQMEKLVNDSKKENVKQKQRNLEIGNRHGTPIKVEEDEEGDYQRTSASVGSNKRKNQ